MGYTYNVFLPGLNKTVSIGEINNKLYRDLVKSLYNKEDTLFLTQLNNIVEHITPGILQEGLTVFDYFVVLLTARMIFINPDLKLSSVCPTTKKPFETTFTLETIISNISKIFLNQTVTVNNFTINYSLLKARDIVEIASLPKEHEFFYTLVSSINSITIDDTVILLNNYNFLGKVKLIEALPATATQQVFHTLEEYYNQISKINVITLNSPFKPVVAAKVNISAQMESIVYFLRLVFNDDLGSVYKIVYNLVKYANFNPVFLDSITPAEQNLFWTFFLQQSNKEQEEKNELIKDGAPSYNGKTSSSEFTS